MTMAMCQGFCLCSNHIEGSYFMSNEKLKDADFPAPGFMDDRWGSPAFVSMGSMIDVNNLRWMIDDFEDLLMVLNDGYRWRS